MNPNAPLPLRGRSGGRTRNSGLVGRDEVALLDRVEHLRVRSRAVCGAAVRARFRVGIHDERAVHLDALNLDPLAVVQHLSGMVRRRVEVRRNDLIGGRGDQIDV